MPVHTYMSDVSQNQWSQWMVAAQSGDKDSYHMLLTAIAPKVKAMIHQKIQNKQTAEEIFQTVMLNIHRARHTYDSSRPFSPWLYTITRNSTYDYLRKHQKRVRVETFIGDTYEPQAQPNTIFEEKALLQDALQTLPESQREAVLLLKIDGLSLEQASQKVGVTEGAIKVRAHRGYEKLKKYFLDQIKEDAF